MAGERKVVLPLLIQRVLRLVITERLADSSGGITHAFAGPHPGSQQELGGNARIAAIRSGIAETWVFTRMSLASDLGVGTRPCKRAVCARSAP